MQTGRFALFRASHALNLTLLYHPFLPNQAERQLFDRFFGFGLNEPHRLYEACAVGTVGFECRAYLPCLKVRLCAGATNLRPAATDRRSGEGGGRSGLAP